jgi:hypothetical protein
MAGMMFGFRPQREVREKACWSGFRAHLPANHRLTASTTIFLYTYDDAGDAPETVDQ